MLVLGLGSNIGNRLEYLQSAINSLSESVLEITAISNVYESPALLKQGAPEDWNIPFFNIAISGQSKLAPQDLLKQIKLIEQKIGRKDRGVWAPREIDIDILAYNAFHVDEEKLKIPHAALCQRAFVLLPFADVAPHWQYPLEGDYKGKTAHEIIKITFSGANSTIKTSYTLNFNRKNPAS
jgi:hypothetical protein